MSLLLLTIACTPKGVRNVAQALPEESAPPPEVQLEAPPADWGANAWPWGPGGTLSVAWEQRLGGPLRLPPARRGDSLFVASGPQAMRIDDGVAGWTVERELGGAAALLGEELWIPSGDRLLKLDADTGQQLGSVDAIRGVVGSPVRVEGQVAWITLDGGSGGQQWWRNDASSGAGGPSSDGNVLWFVTKEGQLLVQSVDGLVRMETLPGPGLHRPAYDGERLAITTAAYEGDQGFIGAYDPGGAPLWVVELNSQASGPAAVTDDLWLVAEMGGAVRAFQPDTGEALWEVHCKAPLGAGVAIGGAKAYVGTTTGELCILDLDDGTWWDSVSLGAPVVSTPLVTPTAVVVPLGDARLVQLTR